MKVDYESKYASARKFKIQKTYEAFFREKSLKYSLVIWGMGALGKTICSWLLQSNINVAYFCDNDKTKVRTFFEGVECIGYEELENIGTKAYIIVAVADKEEKYNRMINRQIETFPNVYHNPLGISAYFLQTFDLDVERMYKWFDKSYNLLCDEKSKKNYKLLFDLRMQADIVDYDLNYLDECFEGNQYTIQDNIIDYKDVHTVIDCGAFYGDSLQEFIDRDIGTEYHCFEMDAEIFNILSQNVKENYSDKKENIYLYLLGVGEKKKDIKYVSDMTGASRASNNGQKYAHIVDLDSVFKDKQVDYIKMDIEGAEESALMGARKLIQRDHPILAISMYHNFTQFVQVPLLIHQICPGYNIYIRHHRYTLDDTVCYAIFDRRGGCK